MTTIEVKNDYMLGRQNENILYYKCMELEQENKQLKKKYENAVADYELEKYKNTQINSILTELEEWINSYIPLLDAGDIVEESSQDTLKEVLDKIQELKEKYK